MRLSLKEFFLILILYFVFNLHGTIQKALAWNFSDVGLPQNVLIWRFTIWRNRAYLAVPRWDKKPIKIPFTLLEAPWPELDNQLQFGVVVPEVRPFPDAKSQDEGICNNLQSVTGIDSDSRGRLWILDSPTRSFKCSAKIVVFDLRRNEKITEIKLEDVSPWGLKCLVVDPVVGQSGVQAYISDPGDETIIVYNLAQKNWRRLKLSSEYNSLKIISTDLAIDRRSSLMYITGYPIHDLFSIDLESVRNEDWSFISSKNTSINAVRITRIGSKMGTSSGLICDLRGGLHYFMVTEIASVRWDTRQKLEAEGHSIILQSELVPCITDYAFDSQKNVWAIVNDKHPFRNLKNMKISLGLKNSKIKRRTIKVWKYNPFFF